MTLVVRTQDPGSGLSAINIVQAKNATVTVPAFTPGTTNEIFVTAEKNNQSKNATVVLDVFDVAGNKTRCDPVLTEVSAEVPEAFALQQNYPNPFNPTTTIPFQVVEPSQVTLVVYDMLGRRVTVLVDGALTAGTYEAVWDGRSAAGMMLPGGVYVYRLRAGAYEQTRVMTLLK
jgi:hypothetical protein